jgi:hypothetical protein
MYFSTCRMTLHRWMTDECEDKRKKNNRAESVLHPFRIRKLGVYGSNERRTKNQVTTTEAFQNLHLCSTQPLAGVSIDPQKKKLSIP